MKQKQIQLSTLELNPNNPRFIQDANFKKLVKSLKDFPQMMVLRPIIVNEQNVIQGGNMRYKALLELGYTEVPAEWIKSAKDFTEAQWKEFLIKDNLGFGEWDMELLNTDWDKADLVEWGMDEGMFGSELECEAKENNLSPKEANKKLADKFIIPPFSIFDTRQGYWQDRKRTWKYTGLRSEDGRDENLIGAPDLDDKYNQGMKGFAPQSSIFDPVLCEILLRWFCPEAGTVLDPFAGGSVRGIVTAKLGRQYIGIDLSERQIIENRKQAQTILTKNELQPVWHIGDSKNVDNICKGVEADFILTCPPYFDLEIYSDDKADISNMDYNSFLLIYKEIIKKSLALLKPDSFIAWVVSDIRDKKGFYRGLLNETIIEFMNNSAPLYNDIILIEQSGTAALRANKTFNSGRKVIKTHQNVLIFFKGNPKNIRAKFPYLDFSELEAEVEQWLKP